MSEFILHSNRTIIQNVIKKAFVHVKDGTIENVFEILPEQFSLPFIDVGNKVLMPGIVDPHVHINEPGRPEWEGFDTATKAALYGGVTTLVDMPLNSSPVTTTTNAFHEKLNAAKNKLHCHCGFWGGIIPGNANEIEPLIDKGVLGFKAFLTHSGIDEFPNVTEEDLRKAMPIIAKHNLPLLVHCEITSPLNRLQNTEVERMPNSYDYYLSTRPKKWEDDAIALMIRLCEEFNCRVHIVHLSSANSIEQIRTAKEKGLPLTVETGQHYLYFNAEEIPDGRTEYKCAPPIREKENNDLLWQALKDGIINFVATDHSPAPPEMKHLQSGDLMKAWGGISSIQFALPALWTAAKTHNCTVTDMAKWLCEFSSKLPGLQKSKGKIEKGYDADLITWDPEKKFTVTEQIIQHRHKITPYLGHQLYGVIEQVFLKGDKVFEKGEIIKHNKGEILINQPV